MSFISLSELGGPLRHFQVSLEDGWFCFDYHGEGVVIRLRQEEVEREYWRRFEMMDNPGDVVALFESMMPAMCYSCGRPDPSRLCASCEQQHIETLRLIATSDPT